MTMITLSRILRAAVLCALCPYSAPSAFAQADPKPSPEQVRKEKEDHKAKVDEALKAFSDQYKKAAGPDAQAAAVKQHLGGDPKDARIVQRLAAILDGAPEPVLTAAAGALARYGDDPALARGAASALGAALDKYKTNETLAVMLCRALGDLGSDAGVPPLLKWIDDENLQIARAAIEALGKIRAREGIPPLIKLALKVERGKVDLNFAPLTARGGAARASGQQRYLFLYPLTIRMLASITGQTFREATEWEDWWQKHGATFTVPGKEPGAKR